MEVVQLTRESIISAAIDILDSYGLADMTMRRLAKHLEVVPGALYWHIPNKQSLIEAIAEEILSPVWEAIAVGKHGASELCEVLRAAMIRHRDGAEVVGAALPVGDITERIIAALIDALTTENASSERARVAAGTLLNFTVGATLHEQSRQQMDAALDRPGVPAAQSARDFTDGLSLIMSGVSVQR